MNKRRDKMDDKMVARINIEMERAGFGPSLPIESRRAAAGLLAYVQTNLESSRKILRAEGVGGTN